MSRIWDISQPLHAAVPVWPGEPAFALHSHAVIGDGCPVNVGGMFTPLHAGTHGDAPLHYANDGASSADCELDAYIGPCLLLDMRHARGRVEMADIDWTTIEESVKKTGRCLIVHEATRTGGFGAELSALVQERCFYHLEAPVERVTGFDTPYPHSLEWAYFPGPVRIGMALKKIMKD